ncbi:MAG: nucleotidyltransferase family protein [archaeon]
MKAVILCAGYATRLYPLTLDKPKCLLPVSGKPVLNYAIEKIGKVKEIDEILIVTNDKFYMDFVWWFNQNKENFKKPVKIVNDGTTTNETRLGGLGDLWFAIEKEKINDDFLVILGDNLFGSDLDKIVDFFRDKKNMVVGVYDLKSLEKARKFGVLEVENNEIISMEEKPENPKSTLISTGIYVFKKENIKDIEEYMKTDNSKDGPGYLIMYFLSKGKKLYSFKLDGKWYDIGSKETYDEANENWENNSGN